MELADLLTRAAALLGPSADVLVGRVDGPEPPDWCRARGWQDWLLALSAPRLEALESARGEDLLAALDGAPPDLLELARAARRLEAALTPHPGEWARTLPGMSPRKAGQVGALTALARAHFAGARRVLDAGAGLGHLTRALATALDVPVTGLERDPERVRRAASRDATGRAAYRTADLDRHELPADEDTLLVGLHACGVLGDELVAAAATSGAGLLLVGCCLQRRPTPTRPALSRLGRRLGLEWPTAVLGLSNLVTRPHGVAGDAASLMAGRERRHALRLVLRGRGLDLEVGAEMRGLDRRHVARGLEHAAGRALARRGLGPATQDELARAAERARSEFAAIRRLSVPRLVLGRVLELAVVLDRGQALAEAGRAPRVAPAFAPELSPRNLALVRPLAGAGSDT